MIIIKHGDTMKHGKCLKCNCEFLYQHKDVKYYYNRIYAYESELEFTYVNCPECDSIVTVEED